jgi:hypothetical protein
MVGVIQNLADNARTWWVGLGVALILMGIAALVTLRLTQPKQPKGSNNTAELPVQVQAQADPTDIQPGLHNKPVSKKLVKESSSKKID